MGMKTAPALLAALLCGCSYVRTLGPRLKTKMAEADTLYVVPARVSYVSKGFLLTRADSARIKAVEKSAEEILPGELERIFPGARIKEVAPGEVDTSRATTVGLTVKAFRRTLPREIASEAIDIVMMIPTYGMNMGFPWFTTSDVYLEIRNPSLAKPTRLKNRDMLSADDREDLRYQIRRMLDSTFSG